jgi:hypothetical protein
VYIRSITPGVDANPFKKSAEQNKAEAAAKSEDVEATALPETSTTDTDLEGEVMEEEEPPAYQPPEPVVEEKKPKKKFTSAQAFVISTFLLAPLIFMFFLAGLAVQSLVYCQFWSPVPIGARIFWWILFSFPCLFATTAISCWAMLFRNLFGKKVRERFYFNEGVILMGMFFLICGPFIAVWVIVGEGMVKVVESCQRRCCPGGLEDEEELEMERGHVESSASDEAEERTGFLEAMDK